MKLSFALLSIAALLVGLCLGWSATPVISSAHVQPTRSGVSMYEVPEVRILGTLPNRATARGTCRYYGDVLLCGLVAQ